MTHTGSAALGATAAIEDSALEGPISSALSSVTPGLTRLLREREAARSQAAELARHTQRLETFLGLASHELRGPATSSNIGVQLAAQRLQLAQQHAATCDATLADQLAAVQDVLTNAASSLDRLTRLVGDLLDVSRLQAGQLSGQPAQVDLLTLVRAAVDEQRQLAPTRRIRLRLPTSRREISLWADADRMRQVLTNLLTNALKYAPADRPVDVRVRVQDGWARVTVHDRGPGPPPAEQARIWEAFHRADGVAVCGGTPRASAQSLGLGLYITKTIIDQHQGKVGVRSAPGQGATFWFALPLLLQ